MIIIVYNYFIELRDKINFLENSILYKENFNAKIVNIKLKNKIDSVLSIRCSDKKGKGWKGTGTKIDDSIILTADHMLSDFDDKERVFPFKCELYDDGELIGKMNIKNSKSYLQVSNIDMAMIKPDFNDKGKKIKPIFPKESTVIRGLPLILVSHPLDFTNDKLTTFGLVVNDNVQKSLAGDKIDYWKNAILTDMSASPGSSGAPIFNTNGDLIGIHVGGERNKGLNLNYQILIKKDFFIYYHFYNGLR